MNVNAVSHRYDIDLQSATSLLARVEQRYERAWLRLETWQEIDTCFALTAWRMSIGAPIDHALSQNAMHILDWYEKKYINGNQPACLK